MKRWYQDDKGNVSSTRIVVVPGSFLALCIVAAGVVAALLDMESGIAISGIGTGLITVLSGYKAVSTGQERK